MAKLFSVSIMTSESVQSYVLSGKAAIDLDDGAFVVVGDYAQGTVYGANDKDQNVHVLTAPAALVIIVFCTPKSLKRRIGIVSSSKE